MDLQGNLLNFRHQTKNAVTAGRTGFQAFCPRDFICYFLFVALWMLMLPGLTQAQTSIGSKDPQRPTRLHYQAITKSERTNWFIKSVVGPESLAAGVVSAGWGTAVNEPREYGPHFSGFAQRYGMRLPEVVMGNGIEAGLGAAWKEDPRYDRVGQGPLLLRLPHAATMTVLAYRGDGSTAPAYARYIGNFGENFIAKSWRPDSESSVSFALGQSALAFAGKFAGNVFDEFWTDVRNRLRHQ